MLPVPVTLFGIKTCDTCRKVRRWLEAKGVEHRYHDLRTDGLEPADLDRWIAAVGLEALLNRRGTTWRNVAPEHAEELGATALRDLILQHPTLIKRPVIEAGEHISVGFGSQQQQALADAFGKSFAVEPASSATGERR